jgi:hypothetical protein
LRTRAPSHWVSNSACERVRRDFSQPFDVYIAVTYTHA